MKKEYMAPQIEVIQLERQVTLLSSSSDGESSREIGGGLGLNLESIDKLQDENC